MAITDELRSVAAKTECANGRCEKLYRGDLETIADRIDEQNVETQRRWMAELDAARDRDGFIELPKDADGEYIRIGDVLDNTHKDGFAAKAVIGISYHPGGKTCVEVDENRLRWHDPSRLRHYKQQIVEDLLREFVSEFNRDDTELCDEEIIERFAAKLRLAESEGE